MKSEILDTVALKRIGTIDTSEGFADVHIGRYRPGGAISIQLFSAEAERPELLMTFSRNPEEFGASLAADEFCSDSWPAMRFSMMATGLFDCTGRVVLLGSRRAAVWRVKDLFLVPPQAMPPAQATRGQPNIHQGARQS